MCSGYHREGLSLRCEEGEILTELLCEPWAVKLLLCPKAAEDESVIQEVAYTTVASCGMRSGRESFQSRRC